MNAWMDNIIELLSSQSVHLAILFVLILGLTSLCHKKTAHLRYLLWAVILVKCLVPPLFTIPMAVLPQKPQVQPTVNEAQAVSFEPQMSMPLDISQLSTLPMSSESMDSVRMPVPEPAVSTQWSRNTGLVITWLVGAIGFAVIIVARTLRFGYGLKQSRQTISASLAEQIQALSEGLGGKRSFQVYQVPGISQPFVWGLVRGTIYIPADFERTGTLHKQNSVLLHEMGHVMRRDPLVNLIQVVVQAVYWFHPLVWVANKKIRAEQEKCCDEIAIAKLNASPKEYGSAIIDTLMHEYQSRTGIPTLAIAGPVKNLEDRIKTIMKPGKRFYTRPSFKALVVTLLLAIVAVPTTVALTQRQEPVPTEDSPSLVQITTNQVGYSNTELIVPAQKTPSDLSSVQLVDLFNLSEGHVTSWPIRGGYRDLIRTILMYNQGDIYYFYDQDEKVGKVIFPRQATWDRVHPLTAPDMACLTLKDLPKEVLLTTLDGCQYQIRFSNPKGPRTGMMMGPLQGDPSDMSKQCLIQVKQIKDATFTVNVEGSDFETLRTQVLLNPKNKVFKGITHVTWNQDEVIVTCSHSDILSEYAFDGKPTSKEVHLKKLAQNKWQITKVVIDYSSGIEANRLLYLKENSGTLAIRIPKNQAMTGVESQTSESNPEKKLASLFMASGMLCQSILEAVEADDFDTALSLCDQVEKHVQEGLAIADQVEQGAMFKALATQFRLWHQVIEQHDKARAIKQGQMLNEMGGNMVRMVEAMARQASSNTADGNEPVTENTLSIEDQQEITRLTSLYVKIMFGSDVRIQDLEQVFEFESDSQKEGVSQLIQEQGNDSQSDENDNGIRIVNMESTSEGLVMVSALIELHGQYIGQTIPWKRTDSGWKVHVDLKKLVQMQEDIKTLGAEQYGRQQLEKQLAQWENAQGDSLVDLFESTKEQFRRRIQMSEYARQHQLEQPIGQAGDELRQKLEQIESQTPEEFRAMLVNELKRQLGPAERFGKLAFRIVAETNSDHISSNRVMALREQLQQQGPFKVNSDKYTFIWLPVRSELNLSPNKVFGSYQGRTYLLVSDDPNNIITADGTWSVAAAYAEKDNMGRPAVGLELDEAGGEILNRISAANIHRPMAIILDGVILSTPTIASALHNRAIITGKFTEQEVRDMVISLQKGMRASKTAIKAAQ